MRFSHAHVALERGNNCAFLVVENSVTGEWFIHQFFTSVLNYVPETELFALSDVAKTAINLILDAKWDKTTTKEQGSFTALVAIEISIVIANNMEAIFKAVPEAHKEAELELQQRMGKEAYDAFTQLEGDEASRADVGQMLMVSRASESLAFKQFAANAYNDKAQLVVKNRCFKPGEDAALEEFEAKCFLDVDDGMI